MFRVQYLYTVVVFGCAVTKGKKESAGENGEKGWERGVREK